MKIKNTHFNLSLLFAISLVGCSPVPSSTNQQSSSPSPVISVANSSSPTSDIFSASPSVSPTSDTNQNTASSPSVNNIQVLTIDENLLSSSSVNETSTLLKWQALNGAKSYRIYQDGKLIADNLTDISYKVDNLRDSTSYTFELVAVNDAGESNKSMIKVVTTSGTRSSGGGGGGGGGGGTVISTPIPTPVPTPTPTISPTPVNYNVNGSIS